MKIKAFTLIEMLIVIAIVVILAGAMAPIIRFTKEDARTAKALTILETIRVASHQYHLDTGAWPPYGAGAVGDGLMANTEGLDGWRGPYVDAETWPLDPWGIRPYYIMFVPPAKLYAVSIGPDNGWDGCKLPNDPTCAFPPCDDICIAITPDINS